MIGSLFGLFRIAADVLRGRYRTAPGHGGVNG
jgi:hypothetical protein